VYCLQAAIATEPVLRDLAGTIREARIVPIGQQLCLLPMTDALAVAINVPGAPVLDGFWKAPAGFGDALAACSIQGPVAFVEADFFGGVGTQIALVWDGGKLVLGPLLLAEGEPLPTIGSPISQALRHLGAVRGTHFDEFDAVSLGRHRQTEHWLPSPTL
jgi:hypothetical protein